MSLRFCFKGLTDSTYPIVSVSAVFTFMPVSALFSFVFGITWSESLGTMLTVLVSGQFSSLLS